MTRIDFYLNAPSKLQVACQIAAKAVRQKRRRLPGPKHPVDLLRLRFIQGVDQHAQLLLHRFCRKSAGDLQLVLGLEVEIDARHLESTRGRAGEGVRHSRVRIA